MHAYQVIKHNFNNEPTILHEGTLLDCWKFLLQEFPDFTVKDLHETGITIS